MHLTIQPFLKQHHAYEALKNDDVKFLLYGGAAGGGKSWLGCEWLLQNCYLYPGSRWFIGREELKRLMQSSYETFKKVCKHHNVPENDWKLNGQHNYIEFTNGSKIDLLDVKKNPGDALFERFGSVEYTGGWLEEAGEIDFLAFDVLKSRIGRHLNKELNIPSKLFITCNPKQNWLYSLFYKPWREGKLRAPYAFVQSFYTDNPHTADEYGENLNEINDEILKRRLRDGDWDYNDDKNLLFEYSDLCDMFNRDVEPDGNRYLVADLAGLGADKTTIHYWEGLQLKEIHEYSATDIRNSGKTATDFLVDTIEEFANDKWIPREHIIADGIGFGSGTVDILKCKRFQSSNSAIVTEKEKRQIKKDPLLKVRYQNLRAQCYFKLAEMVKAGEIGINPTRYEEEIKFDLSNVKRVDAEKEGALKILTKDEMKQEMQRSPDHGDALKMRMYFEIKKPIIKTEMETVDRSPKVNRVTGKPAYSSARPRRSFNRLTGKIN